MVKEGSWEVSIDMTRRRNYWSFMVGGWGEDDLCCESTNIWRD